MAYHHHLLLLLLSLFSLTHGAAPPPPASPIPHNYVCDPKRYTKLGLDVSKLAFCDKSLPYPIRAKNLVDSLDVAEKVQQLGHDTPGVNRLGIPKYNWWSEALHGVSDVGGGSSFKGPIPGATSFPAPITTTASFNQALWKKIGQAVSTEARAMHNYGVAGLTFWSPNINVVRDPRWGRTLETPGEDPYVVGRYAVNYVRGLQDVEGEEITPDLNTRPLKVSACCKHYTAYDVDHWKTTGNFLTDRAFYNANVTERDIVETFNHPFEACVKEGDVSSVMCSYNQVNGLPTCVDARLLSGTIRGEWNLHGYIVSDCDSIETLFKDQKFLDDTQEDAVAQVLKAGLDMDCGRYYPNFLPSALSRGLVKESDIDKALINDYIVLMRLGFFDGNPKYESLTTEDVCSKEHIELAVEAARQGIVLLKNDMSAQNHLPLSTEKHKKIAVVGPHANATVDMIGNYAGVPCRYVSPIGGLAKYANVTYKPGCADVFCKNDTFIFPAAKAAREADATIIVAGLNLGVEAESLDRIDLELPGYQNNFISQVAVAAKGPVILVLLTAGGINIEDYLGNNRFSKNIDAIVWAGYPGEEGGQAIADVIYGKHNPGGRLPVTWYKSDYVWQLPMTSMQMRPVEELGYPGRTYKFYNGSTIFPFGYGLSYTKFSYELVSEQRFVEKKMASNSHCISIPYNESAYMPPCPAALVDDLSCKEDITVEVNVTNTGRYNGSDVVMLYHRLPEGVLGAPIKQLVGFERVSVEAGKSKNVKFKLNSCKSLSMVTDSAYVALPPGDHTIMIGDGGNAINFPFQVYLKH